MMGGQVVAAGIDDMDQLKRYISTYKPKRVFIQAIWVRAESLKPLKDLFKHVEFYLHIHSHIPFLGVEGHAFTYMEGYISQGWGIIFNNIHAYELFKHFPNAHYLPNMYNAPMRPQTMFVEKDHINFGCFGSVRPMKNHLVQALAAIRYAESKNKQARFHVNYGRSEDGGEQVKKNLINLFRMHTKHQLIDVPWKTHSDFIDYMNTNIDISMQLSMSESFNLVAADSIAAGVPLIVSPEIDWVYPGCISYYSDVYDITRTMDKVIHHRFVEENRRHLAEFNHKAVETWKAFIYETGI